MVFGLFHHAVVKKNQSAKDTQKETDPLKIGPILYARGVITMDDLEAAVETQAARRAMGKSDSSTKLGEILVSNGACSRKQLEEALAEQFSAHLPDSSKANDAMDALDKILARSEARGEEMKKVTQAVKRETLSMSIAELKTVVG